MSRIRFEKNQGFYCFLKFNLANNQAIETGILNQSKSNFQYSLGSPEKIA